MPFLHCGPDDQYGAFGPFSFPHFEGRFLRTVVVCAQYQQQDLFLCLV